jgi:hypothetical protein
MSASSTLTRLAVAAGATFAIVAAPSAAFAADAPVNPDLVTSKPSGDQTVKSDPGTVTDKPMDPKEFAKKYPNEGKNADHTVKSGPGKKVVKAKKHHKPRGAVRAGGGGLATTDNTLAYSAAGLGAASIAAAGGFVVLRRREAGQR